MKSINVSTSHFPRDCLPLEPRAHCRQPPSCIAMPVHERASPRGARGASHASTACMCGGALTRRIAIEPRPHTAPRPGPYCLCGRPHRRPTSPRAPGPRCLWSLKLLKLSSGRCPRAPGPRCRPWRCVRERARERDARGTGWRSPASVARKGGGLVSAPRGCRGAGRCACLSRPPEAGAGDLRRATA